PSRRGSQKEELFERQLSLKNISFRQTKIAFKIEWSQNLSIANQLLDVGRVFSNRVHHRVAKLFAFLVPASFLQVVRGVLHEARHHVLAGGATDGSVRLGITMSMYGRREKRPYFASSYARSMYSTLGEIEIAPRKCAPGPGSDLKFGRPSSARFTLPDEPRYL